MTFNSLIFLFGFLPISLILYTIVRNMKIKNIILLILSLIFYSWSSVNGFIVLILSIAWNFVTGIELEAQQDARTKKIIFWVAIAVNLLILALYKYLNFTIGIFGAQPLTIMAPLGLSFFTFSEISYLADVYTKKSKSNHNLLEYAIYVSFFGKISMGPIVTYHSISDQLSKRVVKRDDISQGYLLLTKGLVKKVLFADAFAQVFASLLTNQSVVGAWIAAIAYMLEIYYDFSGYSDMAIGIGRMFGFKFEPNFNHPYNAHSVQDFWRRWHISLSLWFRDYLYIPLGGSRVDDRTYIRNIFIVWFCTGLWHGANWTFIVWGLYYGAFTLLEKYKLKTFLKEHIKLSHVYTLIIVLIGWVFFSRSSIGNAIGAIGTMFGVNATSFVDSKALFEIVTHIPLFVFGILLCLNIVDKIQILILNRFKSKGIVLCTIIYLLFFICSVIFIIGDSYQTFLYSAF